MRKETDKMKKKLITGVLFAKFLRDFNKELKI
jgi:hypothetical protein